jgi:ABC-type branched-subunit amino acid transport system permease subunit
MRRPWWLLALAAGLLGLPSMVRAIAPEMTNYLLNNFAIQSLLWVTLALSYDLSVGHAGTVTLAHPAFFGIGAYAAAILATAAGTPFPLNVAVAVLLAGAVAVAVGFPFFRLSDVFFAIGTLGFAFMTQIVANNWQSLTRGALCITQIPRPAVEVAGVSLRIANLTGFYYLILAIAALTVAVYLALTTGRVGRAFAAVRGDEGLAQSFALNPLTYKMLAFVAGAMLAALAGVFQAHHVAVLCPDTLGTFLTLNLLIIVFVGGAGTLRGVVLGALLFTLIPEFARFAQVLAQLAYGVVLLVVVLYTPDGVEGLIRRVLRRGRGTVSLWRRAADEDPSPESDHA